MRPFLILPLAVSFASAEPKTETKFFDGTSLQGWSTMGDAKYWSVKDGVIVGNAREKVTRNEFLWSKVEVKDFYLAVDVKLSPKNRNAGIQFRSKPVGDHGQAVGYQADVGGGVWGKLYHEHGRGKLDWNNRAESVIKNDDWNRYEILAVGHRIWTAINGELCVAIEDPKGELSGRISFQIHSGPPQNVQYRPVKLVHDPAIALEKQSREQLLDALPRAHSVKAAPPLERAFFDSPVNRKGWTEDIGKWRGTVDANDPGMSGKWFASQADDSAWKSMSLPRFYESSGLPGHDGTAWFRKRVSVPEEHAGQDLTIELGPIDDMDMTWFNGKLIGGIEVPGFWLKPRVYRVPGNLVRGGENVITVRVIDHGRGGGFGAGNPKAMKLYKSPKSPVYVHGDWKYRAGVSLESLGLGELRNPPRHWTAAMETTEEDVIPMLRPLATPSEKPAGFGDRFEIDGEQHIVIFGGANASECDRNGWLETRLVTAHPQHRVRVRNLAWPTDTVFQQWRPRNFFSSINPSYGERDGRELIPVDIAFLWFGQMESLEGEAGLGPFKAAYETLVDGLSSRTEKIVLVSPVPFSDPLGIGFDLGERNRVLTRYAQVVQTISSERGLLFVDLSELARDELITSDGALLSEAGHENVAQEIAVQLRFDHRLPPNTGYIRQSIQEKNALWRQYWMPSNWAFLYGNRQSQPSSRDHTNPEARWFPEEIKAMLPAIEKLEDEIQALVKK